MQKMWLGGQTESFHIIGGGGGGGLKAALAWSAAGLMAGNQWIYMNDYELTKIEMFFCQII